MPASPSTPTRTNSLLRAVLLRGGGLVVAAAAALVVIRSFDLGAVAAALGRADPAWLVPALGVVVVQLVLRAVRFQTLLPAPPDGRPIGVGSLTAAMLVASLVNNLTPARIGDGVKCYIVARRHRLPFSGVLGTIMLEHGLDGPSLAVVAALTAVLLGVAGPFRTVSLVAGAVGLTILALLFTTDLGRLGGRLHGSLEPRAPRLVRGAILERLAHFGTGFRVIGRRRVVVVALLIGLVAWFCDALAFWLVADSLGLPLSLPGAMLIGAAVALSTVLPGAPGYVGTLELAAVGAAGAVGLAGPGTLALALVFHAIQFVPLSVAGLLVVAMGGHRVPVPALSELRAAPALARSEVSRAL